MGGAMQEQTMTWGLFQICELAQMPLHKKTDQFLSATGLSFLNGR